MPETILQSAFVTELVLPFLLIFTLIFAILEKTKILGDDKKQINAIISLVIGIIFISFTKYVGLTTNLIGIMVVVAVVILIFMMLFSFASGDKELKMPSGLKITFGILIALVIVISLLVFTGYWDKIISSVTSGSGIVANIVFIIIIIAAVAIVLWSGKKSS